MCQIPLTQESFQLFPQNQVQDTQHEDIQVLGQNYILTEQESMPYLNHLHNQCTYFRTYEFLWQYCFRKFLRQYDDEITVVNEKKPHPEVFYLGFGKQFTNSTNTSKVYVNLQSYNLFVNDNNLPQYLEIIGRVGKAINTQLNVYKKIAIVINESKLRIRVEKVFDGGQTFILYQGEDQKIQGAITNYQIEYDTGEQKLLTDQNVYENYIYLNDGSALSQFKVGYQVAIIIKDYNTYQVKLFKIKNIWTDNLIEIDQNLQTKKLKQVENIVNLNEQFEDIQWFQDQDRVMNIVRRHIYSAFGLQQGDNIKIYAKNQFHLTNSLIQSKVCKIIKIFHNIALLDSDCSIKGQDNYAFIGRSRQQVKNQSLDQYHEYIERQKLGIQFISQINFLNNSLNKQDNINLFAFKYPDEALISFYLSVSQNRDTFGLNLLFTSDIDDQEGIQVYITDTTINVKQRSDKKTTYKKNDFFRNSSFVNRQIWILFYNKQIMIGWNNELKFINLITIFDYQKLNYQIHYCKILQKRTNNLVMKNIKIQNINQAIINSYQQIILRPNQTEIPYTNILFQEQYLNGDYCDPVKAPRNFWVTFQCAESWFEIIRIDEPSMCSYQLYIGTNLLCFDYIQQIEKKSILSDEVDTINCVLQ